MLTLREIAIQHQAIAADFANWLLLDGVILQVDCMVGDIEPELLMGPACRYGRQMIAADIPMRRQKGLPEILAYIDKALLRQYKRPPTPLSRLNSLLNARPS